jgi:hypothetical protein
LSFDSLGLHLVLSRWFEHEITWSVISCRLLPPHVVQALSVSDGFAVLELWNSVTSKSLESSTVCRSCFCCFFSRPNKPVYLFGAMFTKSLSLVLDSACTCMHCDSESFTVKWSGGNKKEILFIERIRRSAACIDFRFEYGCSPLSASCVTISNPDLVSSSDTGVKSGIRNWKSTYLIELDVRKPLVVSIFQKSEELRLYNLV